MRKYVSAKELVKLFYPVLASEWSINNLCRQGKIPFITFGRKRFFCTEEIENYLEQLQKESLKKPNYYR